MANQLASDLAALATRRRALGLVGLGMGGLVAACNDGVVARAATDNKCIATPTETRGPFPADGTNGRGERINVLTSEAVIRKDIRSSFAGMDGVAEGVPVELELALVGVDCAALTSPAFYLWQNDAVGDYSLYNNTDVNYLRGLQSADAGGIVRFTTIVPGCYGGRYPHCHFEVYSSTAAALGGDRPLLVSQLAFPDAECRELYRNDARYGDSLRNLVRLPIERDFVFADSDAEGRSRQTIALKGSPAEGFRGNATIVVG